MSTYLGCRRPLLDETSILHISIRVNGTLGLYFIGTLGLYFIGTLGLYFMTMTLPHAGALIETDGVN